MASGGARFLAALLVAGALLGAAIGFGDEQAITIVLVSIALFALVALGLAGRRLRLGAVALISWIVLLANRAFFLRTGEVMDLPLAQIVPEVAITGMLSLVAVVLLVVRLLDDDRPFVLSGVQWAFLGYVGLAAISLSWTPNAMYAGFWLLRLTAAVMLAVLVVEDDRDKGWQRLTYATVLGIAPNIALPVISYLTGIGSDTNVRADFRATGFWFHPNNATIVAGAIAVFLVIRALQGVRPGLHAVGAAAALSSAIVAGGKAGFVGTIIALAVTIALFPRLVARFSLAPLVLAVSGVIWAALIYLDVGIFVHIRYYSQLGTLPTLFSRWVLWANAMRVWTDSVFTVLLGKGFTYTRAVGIPSIVGLGSLSHAHNAWIQTLVELGAVGLSLMVVVHSSLASGFLRMRRRLEDGLAVPVFSGLVVLFVTTSTNSIFGGLLEPQFYLFIGLAVALDAAIRLASSPGSETAAGDQDG